MRPLVMSPELIGILAVGVALAGFNWRTLHSLDVRLNGRMDELKADLSARLDELSRDHQDLRERVARIEVWLEVLLGRHRQSEEAVLIDRSAEASRTPSQE